MLEKMCHTWNAKCPIFLGDFTPKTSNYCLKNRALGFPGSCVFELRILHGCYSHDYELHASDDIS